MKPITNMGASVHQRLKNAAEDSGRTFNDLSQYYALERFLYRLSKSKYADLFVLKGALMLVAWKAPILRVTHDIDLLAKTSNDLENIKAIVSDICITEVPDDGLTFDPKSVVTSQIAEDADYKGVRTQFEARLATSRLPMQIDMGFSDIITPGPVEITYPTILDYPAPVLRAYNPETAIAEKFEAMVSLGRLNSRMKDFFDIWLLSRTTEFQGHTLLSAIQATFQRRKAPAISAPQAFSEEFANDPAKQSQWAGFLKRMRPSSAPTTFPEVVGHVREFLQPLNEAMVNEASFNGSWKNQGPWTKS